jgi:hypothetical protein
MLARTEITGVLATGHLFLDDSFDVVVDDLDNVVAELITLIPITDAEIALATNAGIDGLLEVFATANPPLLDVTRPST